MQVSRKLYTPEEVVSGFIGMRQHSIIFQVFYVQAQQLVRRWWNWWRSGTVSVDDRDELHVNGIESYQP